MRAILSFLSLRSHLFRWYLFALAMGVFSILLIVALAARIASLCLLLSTRRADTSWIWARSFLWTPTDIATFLAATRQIESLPTISKGLTGIGFRTIFEWYWRRDAVLKAGAPGTHPMQRPYFFFPGLSARPFYNSDDFPWVKDLEAQALTIAAECRRVYEGETGFSGYHNELGLSTDPFAPQQNNLGISKYQNEKWRMFYFYRSGVRNEKNWPTCPVTTQALESIPRIEKTMICFSALCGQTWIPPHVGSFNGILRVHLPLIVPKNCGLRVAGREETWEVGKVLIFDDSFVHEAWNGSDDVRIVLFFNILHPDLPEAEGVEIARFIQQELPKTPLGRVWTAAQARHESRNLGFNQLRLAR